MVLPCIPYLHGTPIHKILKDVCGTLKILPEDWYSNMPLTVIFSSSQATHSFYYSIHFVRVPLSINFTIFKIVCTHSFTTITSSRGSFF